MSSSDEEILAFKTPYDRQVYLDMMENKDNTDVYYGHKMKDPKSKKWMYYPVFGILLHENKGKCDIKTENGKIIKISSKYVAKIPASVYSTSKDPKVYEAESYENLDKFIKTLKTNWNLKKTRGPKKKASDQAAAASNTSFFKYRYPSRKRKSANITNIDNTASKTYSNLSTSFAPTVEQDSAGVASASTASAGTASASAAPAIKSVRAIAVVAEPATASAATRVVAVAAEPAPDKRAKKPRFRKTLLVKERRDDIKEIKRQIKIDETIQKKNNEILKKGMDAWTERYQKFKQKIINRENRSRKIESCYCCC